MYKKSNFIFDAIFLAVASLLDVFFIVVFILTIIGGESMFKGNATASIIAIGISLTMLTICIVAGWKQIIENWIFFKEDSFKNLTNKRGIK